MVGFHGGLSQPTIPIKFFYNFFLAIYKNEVIMVYRVLKAVKLFLVVLAVKV